MITFYSGTPGSGKSYHMAKEIKFKLRIGRNIISTVNIDVNKVSKNGKKKVGDFVYVPILELDPTFLYQYAFKKHKKGKESQTIIIIDECQILFNPREYQRKGRADWILFFTRHRHLGYSIIMTSQFDRLVDRQIRSLFEYEVKHRKINNYGLLFLLPWTYFACIEYWYGNKMVVSRRFMKFNKKTAGIYDSYVMYDEFAAMMAEEVKTNKKIDGRVVIHDDAPDDLPDITTDCVINPEGLPDKLPDKDNPPQPLTDAPVGAETGVRGPRRSDRRRPGDWWLKGLILAPIKTLRRKAG
jgi:zona occludens toxin (predicted ATPase)